MLADIAGILKRIQELEDKKETEEDSAQEEGMIDEDSGDDSEAIFYQTFRISSPENHWSYQAPHIPSCRYKGDIEEGPETRTTRCLNRKTVT